MNVSSSPSEQEHLDFVGEQHIHPSGYLEIIQGYFNCYIGFKMAKKKKKVLVFMNGRTNSGATGQHYKYCVCAQ